MGNEKIPGGALVDRDPPRRQYISNTRYRHAQTDARIKHNVLSRVWTGHSRSTLTIVPFFLVGKQGLVSANV